MFKKSRKDKLVDQVQDVAHNVSDAVAPHVKKAREEISPYLESARKEVGPRLEDARDQLVPKVAELRQQFDKEVAPRLEDVRDRAVAGAKQVASDARDQASTYAAEAERRGSLAASALKGEDVKRSTSKKTKLLVVVALAGAGVFVARKLAGGGQQDNWQTSYTPSPAPTPSPVAAPTGSTPGETVADSAEEPHPVTTPDDPAETVDLQASADGTDATSASTNADDDTK